MKVSGLSALLPLCGAAAAAAVTHSARTTHCTLVKFQTQGSALVQDLRGLNLSDPNLADIIFADAFPTLLQEGNATLAAQYCVPQVQNANKDKLQVLWHGITSNKAYWDALGGSLGYAPYQQGNYSWVEVATRLGYPTLSVDRVGSGASSHPDPILVVQGPFELALYHNLVQQIKAGTTGVLPQAYTSLIYVGHSYGSELGAAQAQQYPNDYESIILTGFSKSVQPSFPGVSLQLPVPAAIHNPAVFGTLNPGYLTSSYQQGRTNSFFGTTPGVDYDPTITDLFYQREDTVSIGQFVSVYLGNIPSPKYTGRVLVLTGEEDQAFCGLGSSALGPAHCGALLPNTATLFPNANYNWHSVPNTGHTVNLHYTATSSFNLAHQFLAGQSFAG